MFAVFLALIWLTPFNNIELNVSLPIELRLDRLVLPVLAFPGPSPSVARPVAPRLRMTWVHLAIGGLLATAFLLASSSTRATSTSRSSSTFRSRSSR